MATTTTMMMRLPTPTSIDCYGGHHDHDGYTTSINNDNDIFDQESEVRRCRVGCAVDSRMRRSTVIVVILEGGTMI